MNVAKIIFKVNLNLTLPLGQNRSYPVCIAVRMHWYYHTAI